MNEFPSKVTGNSAVAAEQRNAERKKRRNNAMDKEQAMGVKVYDRPSERRSLDELRDPVIAANFSQFEELYVTHDDKRLIYAAALKAGADFRSRLAEDLPDDPVAKEGQFVRCPGPRRAAAAAKLMSERLQSKGTPESQLR